MSNVAQLRPMVDVPTALRNIADAYEAGNYGQEDCTLIIGRDVFHVGCLDDAQAGMSAVFNCQLAIHKLMAAALE